MKKLVIIILCLLLTLPVTACTEPNQSPKAPEVDYAVYSIFYHSNEGELTANPVAYNYFTPSFKLKAPTRKGYRFLGWSTSEDLSSPVLDAEVVKGTTGNLNFYAVWGELFTVRIDSTAPEFYTITYVSGPVLAGEVATVHIATAEPIGSLVFWNIGAVQEPDSCVYDEALGVFVVKFTLNKNISVIVNAEV